VVSTDCFIQSEYYYAYGNTYSFLDNPFESGLIFVVDKKYQQQAKLDLFARSVTCSMLQGDGLCEVRNGSCSAG
jgi:hypothetical protein